MTSILICGGAGYIGAHMSKMLASHGYDLTVFDNLSTGHRAAVQWGRFVEGDVLDSSALDNLFSARRIDVVMHFCAVSQVADSVHDPYAYYRNNVVGSLNLLEAMRRHDVNKLVFSSTASIYGTPISGECLTESHPPMPANPYGVSKRMVEQMLEDAARAYGLRAVALRYFNAAGADPDGLIGESHYPESHLIPNVLRTVLGTNDRELQIFGDDYETRDGTCVRDYVHVNDLADAHLLAMRFLEHHAGMHCFNLGSGQGSTVLEVIAAVQEVTGRHVPFKRAPRRAGDLPLLVADIHRARDRLGWTPACRDIRTIIETAWRWHLAPRY